MGQHPTEEELFQMISEVDENASGSIGALWGGLNSYTPASTSERLAQTLVNSSR